MAPRSGASRTSYGFRLLDHLNKGADAEFFTRFLECVNIQLPPVSKVRLQVTSFPLSLSWNRYVQLFYKKLFGENLPGSGIAAHETN